MRRLSLLICCVLLGCSDVPERAGGKSAAGPAAPDRTSRSDVLLVTLDTARADRIGAYGHALARTPQMDALAARGLLFEQAVAPTPITLPSHTSILTGVLPPAHGVHDNGLFALGPQAQLVSEVFRAAGWRTGAFVGSYVLDARFGLDQGFEVYDGPSRDPQRVSHGSERAAPEVSRKAIEWIEGLEADEPFFAWVHFYDPHFPYTASRRFQDLDPYDAELARCDVQIGRLLRAIQHLRPGREPVVVVTSDHGEGLGDHQERTHGLLLYQPTLRVPLIIAGPGVIDSPGSRIPRPVSTASVAATLLAAAGISGDGVGLHASRWPSLLGETAGDADRQQRAVYFENYLPFHAHRWRAARGVVDGAYKLIDQGKPEVYRLSDDPHEARDLADADPERRQRLTERLEQTLAASPPLGWAADREVDRDERVLLESLGYVESTRGGDAFSDELPDVRERLGDVEALRIAKGLIEHAADRIDDPVASSVADEQRDAQVAALLERAGGLLTSVRARNPHSTAATRRLSRVEMLRGDHSAAAALLEEVVRDQPFSLEDRFALAQLYGELGRSDVARQQMESLVAEAPDYEMPVEWLAAHHCRGSDDAACEAWLVRVIEVVGTDKAGGRRAQRVLEARRKRSLRSP